MLARLAPETHLPATAAALAPADAFFDAREQPGEADAHYLLVDGLNGERVVLPREVVAVLRQVVTAMHAGLAVTIAPQTQTLTTQQSADLLGVSRPTFVKLLDAGHLPHERVGSHRRVLLRDVLAYREAHRGGQYAALASMGADDAGLTEAQAAEELRQVRSAVAARRRRR